MASKDDVLPLSKPIVGVSGKVYEELPVPAGTGILISILAYNLYVPPVDMYPCRSRRAEIDSTLLQEQGCLGTRRL